MRNDVHILNDGIHMVFHKQSKCLIACRKKFQKLVCYTFSHLDYCSIRTSELCFYQLIPILDLCGLRQK
ncbi:hypothetical protein Gotur_009938 [Gossypium turneri]